MYDLSAVDAAAERERPPEKYPYAKQVRPVMRMHACAPRCAATNKEEEEGIEVPPHPSHTNQDNMR